MNANLQNSNRGNFHGIAVVAPILLLPLALMGPNLLLGIYACGALSIGIMLLWRPSETPILLFIFLYQWLQAAMGPLYGNMFGLQIDELAPNNGQHALAGFLEITGVLSLAIGMRIAVGQPNTNLNERIRAFVSAKPLGFWLRLYVAASIFGAICGAVAWNAGGLQQPLLSLSQIKWAAYVMLTFATFSVPGKPKSIWLAVSGFEFVLAVGGYFSNFKDIFFYAIIAIVGCGLKLKPKELIFIFTAGLVLICMGVVWSAVKIDYRDFVNGGSSEQIVSVNYPERMSELSRLIGDLDNQELTGGVEKLAHRTMYFEFFGAAIANVPLNIPHTGGEIWGAAVLRSFMPRFIFSDKAPVHDSELTRQYTGIRVSSYDQGTSISMGYMAEAYIDFGPILMFLPITLLGCGLGFIYRWLVSAAGRDGVLGAALATFTLMPAYAIETSVLKLIPAVLLCVVACLVILKFLAPLIWGVERKPALIGSARRRLADR